MPDSIRHPGNEEWIPTCVGMTYTGSTAQFTMIFENGYNPKAWPERHQFYANRPMLRLPRDCLSNLARRLVFLVRPPRLERGTYGFEVRRSIQLSYGRMTERLSVNASIRYESRNKLGRVMGLEPMTSGATTLCSSQLSYTLHTTLPYKVSLHKSTVSENSTHLHIIAKCT